MHQEGRSSVNRNVEYRDLNIKPIRKGGQYRRVRVATEQRPIGQVRLGNRLSWTGTISVVTHDRKAQGSK